MLAPLASAELLEFERTFNRTRLAGVFLAIVLGPFFPNLGLAFVVLFGALLLAQFTFVAFLVGRGVLGRQPDRVAWLIFAIDLFNISFGVLVFSADPNWTTFIVLPLVIIAGAFRFGMLGAIASAVVMSLAYVAIAFYRAQAFGYQTEPQRAIFHISIFLLTGFLVFSLVRELASLREVDRAKSEFMATMSHDFRSPLTVVRGVLELLLSERPGELNERQRELAGRAERNVHRLEGFAEDVLEMARIEQGAVALDVEEIDMTSLLHEVVDDHRALGDARGQTITVDGAKGLTVAGDPARIRQIVGNLLSNAIKYAPPASPISVAATRDGAVVRVRVSDRGPGVPREDRERIFEPFTRGRRVGDVSGVGLGLSIARSFAELHRGSLRYEDVPGGGAAFVLSLPQGAAE